MEYPNLTKFEKTDLLGVRATQIERGAKSFVDVKSANINREKPLSPLEIAELELLTGVIPIKVRRQLPNGNIMIIKIKSKNQLPHTTS